MSWNRLFSKEIVIASQFRLSFRFQKNFDSFVRESLSQVKYFEKNIFKKNNTKIGIMTMEE